VAENVPWFGLAALVWVGAGVLRHARALAYAEVAVLLPRAGGNYVFLSRGLRPNGRLPVGMGRVLSSSRAAPPPPSFQLCRQERRGKDPEAGWA